MLRNTFTVICLSFCSLALGQENSVTLAESINIALENNIELQGTELIKNRAKINFNQSKWNIAPAVNGSYIIGLSNGRSIDPFTNAYINRELTFSNAGLRLDAVVFNGFQLLNRIRLNKLNFEASKMEVEEAKQNLTLNVTLAYLQVLNNQDLVQLAKNRLATTGEQLNRLETLYKEEVGNPADYTDIRGQIALDRTAVIQSENALQESLLNLVQLMNVDYKVDPQGLDLLVDVVEYPFTAEEVYVQALQNLPTFQARELRIEAAKKGVNVARARFVPELALFAQLNTNYSSAAQIFLETGTRQVETGSFINLNGETLPVFANETMFAGEEITYNDQFENNLNSIVGVSLRLPVFNGFDARNSVALEKINLQESLLEMENTKLQFEQAIEQAYNDMQAAGKRYEILQEQVEAFEESFRINEIRFNSGVSTIVEYTISKNNLDNSRINLANAKYEYLLRVKILEYYRGNI